MAMRYVIRVKDPATLDTISEIKYLFSSVSKARENLIDMLLRSKQLPCRLECVLNSKWADESGVETYAHIVVTFPKRGNEKVYYHINKIEVTDDQLNASEETDTPPPITAPVTPVEDVNPFDLLKRHE